MAKYYGSIGFAVQVETDLGVWQEQITERNYSGNVLQKISKWQEGEQLNPDLVTQHRLSILSDPFADEHFHAMRYITWMGAKWKIVSVQVKRPRLILTIGGVYNEQTKESAQDFGDYSGEQ